MHTVVSQSITEGDHRADCILKGSSMRNGYSNDYINRPYGERGSNNLSNTLARPGCYVECDTIAN